MLPFPCTEMSDDAGKTGDRGDDVGDGQDASEAVQETTLIHLTTLEVSDVEEKSSQCSHNKTKGDGKKDPSGKDIEIVGNDVYTRRKEKLLKEAFHIVEMLKHF